MLLRNLHNVQDNEQVDIRVSGSQISDIFATVNATQPGDEGTIDFEDAIVFPGLINSHDHLDFNLYPQLGRGNYNNYVEWGTDIHKHYKDTINKVLKIPKDLRIQWGIYKNLLNGITTVVNHGEHLDTKNDLIDIVQECNVLHSPRFEKNWKYKMNKPFMKKQPIVIHLGEGKDVPAWEEINSVIKWNLFKRNIYAVHGIAMDSIQAGSFEALIWCPYSNYFLIDRTADVAKLKHSTNILFGTDSTISASWNLWEHLKIAYKEKALSNNELFNSLTLTPANMWKLPRKGSLNKNFEADIVVAKKRKGATAMEAFYAINPADILMVVHRGNIRLFDSSMLQQITANGINTTAFSKILVNDCVKYVAGDVSGLMNEIRSYYDGIELPVNIAV